MKDYQDAFGQAYHSYFKGKRTSMILERNDSYVESVDISEYFSEYKDWSWNSAPLRIDSIPL